MRRPLIVGNWKMNKTSRETVEYLRELKGNLLNPQREVGIAPPYTSLEAARKELGSHSTLHLCAQNMHYESSGAYTGEISPLMLLEMGVRYVIVGHSERRHYFGENDALLNKKVKSAMIYGLLPIICVGETLQERERGQTDLVINRQVKGALQGISDAMNNKTKIQDLVFAYEPVWAIGTGKTCHPQEADRVCCFIRSIITALYDREKALSIRILYGGSVKSSNIKELMAQNEIDGVLVGGASLDVLEFTDIINYQ